MTVPNTYDPVTGTGSTAVISVTIDFPFSNTTDGLLVTQKVPTLNEVRTAPADFTFSLRQVGLDWVADVNNAFGTGTVSEVTISRATTLSQEYSQPDGQAMDTTALEAQLDKIVRNLQELADGDSRQRLLDFIELLTSLSAADTLGLSDKLFALTALGDLQSFTVQELADLLTSGALDVAAAIDAAPESTAIDDSPVTSGDFLTFVRSGALYKLNWDGVVQGMWHGHEYDATGFNVVLTYSGSTRTLSMAAKVGGLVFWTNGIRRASTPSTIQHGGFLGIVYIYRQGSNFQASQTKWNHLTDVPICKVYWNWDVGIVDGWMVPCIYPAQHNPVTTQALEAMGTRVDPANKFTLGDLTFLGVTGDADVQYSISGGKVVHGGTVYTLDALPAGGPYQMLKRKGTTGGWVTYANVENVPYLEQIDRLSYNNPTGGDWLDTFITTNGERVSMWLCALPALAGDEATRFVIVAGQSVETTLADSQAVQWADLALDGIEDLGLVLLAKMTYIFDSTLYSAIRGDCALESVVTYGLPPYEPVIRTS